MTVAAAVLAAGFSRRLGRPKQEVVLGGETLLARAVRTAVAAELEPVIVVVQEARWAECVRSLGATVAVNERAAEGMATSVVASVLEAQRTGPDGLVLLTCDQPLLTPSHLRALCADRARPTASAYAGRAGVPAFFPATAFDELLRLKGDRGARDLLRGARSIVDEDLALDIDTEADLEVARVRLAADFGRKDRSRYRDSSALRQK